MMPDKIQNKGPQGSQYADRSVVRAMINGMRGTCPACGRARLFASLLAVRDHCGNCGTELHHHRADDLPAYLNIMIVGHVVVGAMMGLLALEVFGIWTVGALTLLVALTMSIALMRPIKGAVIGAQWALFMHGFGGNDD